MPVSTGSGPHFINLANKQEQCDSACCACPVLTYASSGWTRRLSSAEGGQPVSKPIGWRLMQLTSTTSALQLTCKTATKHTAATHVNAFLTALMNMRSRTYDHAPHSSMEGAMPASMAVVQRTRLLLRGSELLVNAMVVSTKLIHTRLPYKAHRRWLAQAL
jgi:hypothetical protein